MGSQQFPINLSGIVVAAMLVLSALLNQPPLISGRPPAPNMGAGPSGPFQNIPARIWEDPFEAVARMPAPPAGSDRQRLRAHCKPLPDPTVPVSPGGDPLPLGAGLACEGELVPVPDAPAGPAAGGSAVRDYLRYLGSADLSRLLVLPVMVDGASHAAAREARLRARMAVHAGLVASGFEPVRADRIGVWTWSPQPGLSVDVPFEAFRFDPPGPTAGRERRIVLLLWMNDQAISRELASEGASRDPRPGSRAYTGTLALIDRMLMDLGYPERGPGAPPIGRFASTAVRVIGPADSDGMRFLYLELLGWLDGDCRNAYRHLDNEPQRPGRPAPGAGPSGPWEDQPLNFAVVSPMATAPWPSLVPRELPDGRLEIRSRANGVCATVALYRTVTTDDLTIAALIDELRLRGIDPATNKGRGSTLPRLIAGMNPFLATGPDPGSDRATRDHVVLISEWDTKFGRTLPDLFVDRVRQLRGLARDRPVPGIHRFSYVRGLDGDSAIPAGAGGGDGRRDVLTLATGNDAGFKEPALGTNQYDYLRRLAQQIAELDWSLKRDNRGSVKAFAILGNDYFDKLLILQALKERFPSLLYVTTDLDAGYLDAKVFRWTRNLVIVSPFGLTLRRGFETPPGEALQGETPPFRHSFQTALYLSVLRTLQGRESELATQVRGASPRRFEVGYGRFVALSNGDESDHGGSALLHPEHTHTGLRAFAKSHAPSLLIVGLCATGLLLLSLPNLRGQLAGTPAATGAGIWSWLESRAVLGLCLFYGAIALLWLLPAILAGEEPFAWLSGVSVWPSEIVRLFAGWVAGICLIYGWRRLRDTDERIALDYGLPAPTRNNRARQRFGAWYRGEPLPQADADPDAGRDAAPPPSVQPAPPAPPARGARLGKRICRLFAPPQEVAAEDGRSTLDAVTLWQEYLPHATLRARVSRVLPITLLFWLFAVLVVHGLIDPLTPNRGAAAYGFDLWAGLLVVGLPFIALLFAAVDEARLCRGLLGRLENRDLTWRLETGDLDCELGPDYRRAVGYWATTELIAGRTAPAAHVIHLPLMVTLFLLFSLSTRFDNWNTPANVLGLIALTVGIVLLASSRLRRTAQRIRQTVVDDLREEVAGIEYAQAKTRDEKLRQLLQRIEAIHEGAYTKWYNEPVFRALAWVLGIGIWILTEYAKVGG